MEKEVKRPEKRDHFKDAVELADYHRQLHEYADHLEKQIGPRVLNFHVEEKADATYAVYEVVKCESCNQNAPMSYSSMDDDANWTCPKCSIEYLKEMTQETAQSKQIAILLNYQLNTCQAKLYFIQRADLTPQYLKDEIKKILEETGYEHK